MYSTSAMQLAGARKSNIFMGFQTKNKIIFFFWLTLNRQIFFIKFLKSGLFDFFVLFNSLQWMVAFFRLLVLVKFIGFCARFNCNRSSMKKRITFKLILKRNLQFYLNKWNYMLFVLFNKSSIVNRFEWLFKIMIFVVCLVCDAASTFQLYNFNQHCKPYVNVYIFGSLKTDIVATNQRFINLSTYFWMGPFFELSIYFILFSLNLNSY